MARLASVISSGADYENFGIDSKLVDQCKVLEMQPYIMRLLLPDGEHEVSGRIYGDTLYLKVCRHNTLERKQTLDVKLDNPQRQYLSDKFFELAMKKYPRQLRHKSNMARDEAHANARVRSDNFRRLNRDDR